MDINVIAKRERDAILLYLWQNYHTESERSDYILDELILMYNLGVRHGSDNKNNTNDHLNEDGGI
jgi:hypothetical protein